MGTAYVPAIYNNLSQRQTRKLNQIFQKGPPYPLTAKHTELQSPCNAGHTWMGFTPTKREERRQLAGALALTRSARSALSRAFPILPKNSLVHNSLQSRAPGVAK